jgi:hypothetical protein
MKQRTKLYKNGTIMRHLLVTLFLWIGLGITASTHPVVVENPPFAFNTHSNVTIERIVSDDFSTTLYLVIYQQQQHWIRISSETYIHANGKKYTVKAVDGIQLDQEVYPDESGKIVFSLTFPPIDPTTQQLDFIESDCDNCFKIYGLNLKPEATGIARITVPQKIKNAAIIKDDGKKLEIPQLKTGKSILKGTLSGYAPIMNSKVNVYVDNPVTDIQEELEVKVKEDGNFELEVPLITTMQVLLRLSAPWYNKYILLSPGKESTVYFDLQQKNCQETPVESLKCPPSKYIWFGGANAEINNQIEDIDLAGLLQQRFHSDQDFSTIAGMTAEQYKSYILDKATVLTGELAQKGLTRKALEFASMSVRYTAANRLIFTENDLRNAYRRLHNLNYEDPLTGFSPPEINDDFYSFLKEVSINNPYSLYSYNCGNIINSCKYLSQREIRFSYTPKEMYQTFIDSGKLSSEELVVATYLRDRAIDNPDSPLNELLKQKESLFIQEMINTGKLDEEQLKQANTCLSLCSDSAIPALTVMEQRISLLSKLLRKEILTHEDLNKINEQIGSLIPEKPQEVSPEQIAAFEEKYAEEIKQMTEKRLLKEKRSELARILGANEGIAFDLLETQLACRKMEEYMPLTPGELQAFSQMKNRFYFDYLTVRNNQLLAQIEKNKNKGGYTIHDMPETDGELAFSEIAKKFEGKVVPSYLILNKQGEQIYFQVGFDGVTIEKTLTDAL